ncbi:UDP-N-acetylmuramoyl-L-alanine--D-glutamate ligase [Candidatus Erwinia haradaeae]|uniref:UDP-N-acetylmuramoylalanine--D-glutamate ligase n=1 Tax=Candidatus Erwinia haradaeae TaxID=1922217 RepID=A0A451DA59_9GAMM|nr:UDP-N-acetylmuramoyl-L-alanine--D-glutamate ligase [Candidatus Erwinia haradaeae]VFP83149.1 UDP-N-acetylmuramoylalanine--D-glutamate ligase [Candidatus Erwinia haradaeae]
MANYQGKQVIIIGLGLTGLSCIDFFIRQGVIPRVIDTRLKPPGLHKLSKSIQYHLGGMNDEWLLNSDLIIRSPGIPLTHPSLIAAAKAGIEIIGDIELFCRETQTPIVAITGSNGKSTVTTLVSEMAKSVGWRIANGGNIGFPALMLLKKPAQLYILELSSFQLETTHSLKATTAVILNITEDHMERYPQGIQQYCAAKQRIYNNAQNCIFNSDDKMTTPIYNNHTSYRRFGIQDGDYQLQYYKKNIWLQAQGEMVLNTNEMQITGQHNFINALAALAIADSINIPRAMSQLVLTTFRGLEHRFQLVHKNNGVRWINDSKSTNVSSTIAALKSAECAGTLWLLLGGDGKSADFSALKGFLEKPYIRLYCFGRDSARLAALRPEITIQTETMTEAILNISTQIKPGDLVLLAPACASLDQFTGFEQRGIIFSNLAREVG